MSALEPTPFGRERAAELWAGKGPCGELRTTGGEDAYVRAVWASLNDPSSSWMTAFWKIHDGECLSPQQKGKEAMTTENTSENTPENTVERIAEIDRLLAELTAERRTLVARDRLAPHADVTDTRRASLEIAVELGADDATIEKLAQAPMLARGERLAVKTRFGDMSRGKCWGRNGDGTWADKEGGTVYLTPGEWKVGSDDGFRRKESAVSWSVEHVTVGTQIWTVGY
jgi:hypothetical protein